jgi:hypothetical protein
MIRPCSAELVEPANERNDGQHWSSIDQVQAASNPFQEPQLPCEVLEPPQFLGRGTSNPKDRKVRSAMNSDTVVLEAINKLAQLDDQEQCL